MGVCRWPKSGSARRRATVHRERAAVLREVVASRGGGEGGPGGDRAIVADRGGDGRGGAVTSPRLSPESGRPRRLARVIYARGFRCQDWRPAVLPCRRAATQTTPRPDDGPRTPAA
jgi:hypothetical protein